MGRGRRAEDHLETQPCLARLVTLSATLAGFVIGSLAGILLAIGIVHNRAMDQSVMPWAVASQTAPILAIAPMVIGERQHGVTGLLPAAVISGWLSFFPVLVGMVKGLRTPDAMQLDLMRRGTPAARRCCGTCAC